jgi:hypothetical protein
VGSTQLEFGEDLAQLSFEIANSNNATLDWTLEENSDWMVVEPSEGSLGTGEAAVSAPRLLALAYELASTRTRFRSRPMAGKPVLLLRCELHRRPNLW